MKNLSLALLFYFCLVPAVFSQGKGGQAGPGAVAQGFINAYVAEVSKPEVTQKKAVAWVKRSPAATDSFKKNLAEIYREGLRKDPEMGYGADAVLGAQDFPERFTVFSEEKKSGVATVVLVGDKTCPMKVEVRLVERGGAWLVDASGDLISGGER